MSGLINSAGSKSGVIGTTELDYEEGTWTATPNSGTLTTAVAKYTKIGNTVYVLYNGTLTGTRTATAFRISGLPFTVTTWTSATMYCASYSREGTDQLSAGFEGGQSKIACIAWGDEADGDELGNGYFVVSGTYITS